MTITRCCTCRAPLDLNRDAYVIYGDSQGYQCLSCLMGPDWEPCEPLEGRGALVWSLICFVLCWLAIAVWVWQLQPAWPF